MSGALLLAQCMRAPSPATNPALGDLPGTVLDDTDTLAFHTSMRSGRLSNEVITRFLEYPADFPGQTSGSAGGVKYKHVRMQGGSTTFTTRCSSWTDGSIVNPSDSAMLVVVRDAAGTYLQTLVNNDADEPIPGDTSKRGSKVVHRGTDGLDFGYTVYLFSQTTSSAQCSLQVSQGGSPPRDLLGGYRYFGGKLIHVGAVPRGDYFEVQSTPSPRSALGGTRMVLFRPDKEPVVSSYVSPGSDHDARLTVPNDDFLARDALLLVGRPWVSDTDANAFPLLRADIVHGPSTGTGCRTPNCWSGPVAQATSSDATRFSGAPVQLTPGRWIVGVELSTEPAGSTATPVKNPWRFCDTRSSGCDTQYSYDRGLLNDPVAELSVVYGQSNDPASLTRSATVVRKISRGAFGSTAPHRFYLEVDVTEPAYFAPLIRAIPVPPIRFGLLGVTVEHQLANVSVGPSWFAQRNAEAGELRVATANMLYEDSGDPDATHAEYKNLANLLGPRGNVGTSPSQQTIWPAYSDAADRGPFQLDSDVVFMTEMGDDDGWPETLDRAKEQGAAFVAEANRNDSRTWRGIVGRNEDTVRTDGVGGVYAASTVVGNSGLKPTVVPPRCWTDTDYYLCWVEGDGDGSGIVPASLKVTTTQGQPILLVGMHLRTTGPTVRNGQMDELADRIVALVRERPGLANGRGQTSANGPYNRVIILGDSNARVHRGGESYRLLRTLRAKLGYAVDAGLALSGSTEPGIATGMHDVTGQFGCFHAESSEMNDECTCGGERQHGKHPHKPYDTMAFWDRFRPTLAPPDQCGAANALHLPWWAGTWRSDRADIFAEGGTPTRDRHDLIILAGRGWEMDDPVRSYRVVQDADTPYNHFAPKKDLRCTQNCRGRGVSLAPGAPGGPGDYAPRHSLRGRGTRPGAAALATDHRPIGATLRIWSGNGARF